MSKMHFGLCGSFISDPAAPGKTDSTFYPGKEFFYLLPREGATVPVTSPCNLTGIMCARRDIGYAM